MKVGVSSNFIGNVSANFPEGFTLPNKMSDVPPAPACPPSQVSNIPDTSLAQGIVIALPFVRTTTVFLLIPAISEIKLL